MIDPNPQCLVLPHHFRVYHPKPAGAGLNDPNPPLPSSLTSPSPTTDPPPPRRSPRWRAARCPGRRSPCGRPTSVRGAGGEVGMGGENEGRGRVVPIFWKCGMDADSHRTCGAVRSWEVFGSVVESALGVRIPKTSRTSVFFSVWRRLHFGFPLYSDPLDLHETSQRPLASG